jgi:hypothetical protein
MWRKPSIVSSQVTEASSTIAVYYTCEPMSGLIPKSLYCKLARVTHTMVAAVYIADQFRGSTNLDPRLMLCILPRNHDHDVFRAVVYDVGHPWRISCMHYKVVTGVVPRQVSRDPNRLKKACRHGTNGESPMDHRPKNFAQQVFLEGPY